MQQSKILPQQLTLADAEQGNYATPLTLLEYEARKKLQSNRTIPLKCTRQDSAKAMQDAYLEIKGRFSGELAIVAEALDVVKQLSEDKWADIFLAVFDLRQLEIVDAPRFPCIMPLPVLLYMFEVAWDFSVPSENFATIVKEASNSSLPFSTILSQLIYLIWNRVSKDVQSTEEGDHRNGAGRSSHFLLLDYLQQRNALSCIHKCVRSWEEKGHPIDVPAFDVCADTQCPGKGTHTHAWKSMMQSLILLAEQSSGPFSDFLLKQPDDAPSLTAMHLYDWCTWTRSQIVPVDPLDSVLGALLQPMEEVISASEEKASEKGLNSSTHHQASCPHVRASALAQEFWPYAYVYHFRARQRISRTLECVLFAVSAQQRFGSSPWESSVVKELEEVVKAWIFFPEEDEQSGPDFVLDVFPRWSLPAVNYLRMDCESLFPDDPLGWSHLLSAYVACQSIDIPQEIGAAVLGIAAQGHVEDGPLAKQLESSVKFIVELESFFHFLTNFPQSTIDDMPPPRVAAYLTQHQTDCHGALSLFRTLLRHIRCDESMASCAALLGCPFAPDWAPPDDSSTSQCPDRHDCLLLAFSGTFASQEREEKGRDAEIQEIWVHLAHLAQHPTEFASCVNGTCKHAQQVDTADRCEIVRFLCEENRMNGSCVWETSKFKDLHKFNWDREAQSRASQTETTQWLTRMVQSRSLQTSLLMDNLPPEKPEIKLVTQPCPCGYTRSEFTEEAAADLACCPSCLTLCSQTNPHSEKSLKAWQSLRHFYLNIQRHALLVPVDERKFLLKELVQQSADAHVRVVQFAAWYGWTMLCTKTNLQPLSHQPPQPKSRFFFNTHVHNMFSECQMLAKSLCQNDTSGQWKQRCMKFLASVSHSSPLQASVRDPPLFQCMAKFVDNLGHSIGDAQCSEDNCITGLLVLRCIHGINFCAAATSSSNAAPHGDASAEQVWLRASNMRKIGSYARRYVPSASPEIDSANLLKFCTKTEMKPCDRCRLNLRWHEQFFTILKNCRLSAPSLLMLFDEPLLERFHQINNHLHLHLGFEVASFLLQEEGDLRWRKETNR